MDSRMIDKRKARDKETDDDSSDTSLVKNPSKRARVDFSSSPKEKSPSPASAQKSPLKTASVADSIAAATPDPSMQDVDKGEGSSNGDVASPASKSNGSSQDGGVISVKHDLNSEPMEPKAVVDEDADRDLEANTFSVFLKSSPSRNQNGNGEEIKTGSRNGTPAPNVKTTKSPGKSQPKLTSSPVSENSMPVRGGMELEVSIKISVPSTHEIMLEDHVFRSDFQTVDSFLRSHDIALVPPSSHSFSSGSSGYFGDVDSSSGFTINKPNSSRWTISSLGSTIPRQSIVSIATTDANGSPEEKMKRPLNPVSKSRKRSQGPIATSTKIDQSSMDSELDRFNVSSNPVPNGSDVSEDSSSDLSNSRGGGSTPTTKRSKQSKSIDTGLGTPSQVSTPGSARKGEGKTTPAGRSGIASDSGLGSGKRPGVRQKRSGSSNFPIVLAAKPVLNTPPPARGVAKIEGTSAKPVSKFEQELNNEPVDESNMEKAKTLWSAIMPGELVFARWRDKNYYSGMVKNKGMNDTWIIDFDDGMEDVASESHIVPIRILGTGIKGVYSPDEKYEARVAEVVGQKFLMDPDTNQQNVKYAIKLDSKSDSPDPKLIWCSRRQLSIKEADAKKLRADFAPAAATPKAGDVSLDNIVSGPRRRTRGNEVETPTASSSSSEVTDPASDSTTPKPRQGKGKKTPAGEGKRKRAAIIPLPVESSQTNDANSASPGKDVSAKKDSVPVKKETATKVSPVRSKNSVIEFGKKKTKKTLFQGIQFFLTASGGGDPGISGAPMNLDPYDKDEIREQIENCGGQVIDTVGSETAEDVFLISDSYARTVKYIYSLAASIPCVSHMWINRCMDLHEIVDWSVFRLPAGWSLEHQDLIQHHERKPLKGCKIFVTSESDQLYNYWKPVLTAAEAVLLKPPKKKGVQCPAGTEVLVTDSQHDGTDQLLIEAKRQHIPVVKPEWLVQTIITGKKTHMYGNEKYKLVFDTEESEDATEDEVPSSSDQASKADDVMDEMQSPD